MTVLIVPSWYRSGGEAQLGAFFREQALALKKSGINVIVADATLQGRRSPSQKQFQLKVFEDEGLLTYSYVTPSFGGWRIPQLGVALCYNNLKKIYKKLVGDGIKIDLIHAHSFFPVGTAAVRLARKQGVPVVLTEHSGGVINKTINSTQASYLRECAEYTDALICVSKALQDKVAEITGTKKHIDVIPNMVDKRFWPVKQTQTTGFCLISAGNLIQSKRFDLTLRAFASAFANEQNVSLKIVGDGILREKLKKLVQDLEIADRVTFTGRLSRTEVVEQLCKSNAFVLASDFETFGVVYIEALACGLPVIGTRNGGADDIITEDCGYLVDTDNVQQLADAMRSVYKNYQKYDKDTLAADCQARFGENVVCNSIIGVYERCIDLGR